MMSIELMKKLEDLKQIKKQQLTQLSKKVDQKKAQSIKKVVDDFAKFFHEKGFQIASRNGFTEAKYGDLNVTLSHEDPSTDYFGVIFRFELDLKALNKSDVIVLLDSKKPGIQFSSNPSQSDSEESRLRNEILSKENEIAGVATRLENFDNEEWQLFIKNENANPGNHFSEPYASMYDLLADLIK